VLSQSPSFEVANLGKRRACPTIVAGIADPGCDSNVQKDRHHRGRLQHYEPDSFDGFFSGVLVWAGGEPFEDSLGVADFSAPDEGAGDSFLAASL
jgi:hypothetical protein